MAEEAWKSFFHGPNSSDEDDKPCNKGAACPSAAPKGKVLTAVVGPNSKISYRPSAYGSELRTSDGHSMASVVSERVLPLNAPKLGLGSQSCSHAESAMNLCIEDITEGFVAVCKGCDTRFILSHMDEADKPLCLQRRYLSPKLCDLVTCGDLRRGITLFPVRPGGGQGGDSPPSATTRKERPLLYVDTNIAPNTGRPVFVPDYYGETDVGEKSVGLGGLKVLQAKNGSKFLASSLSGYANSGSVPSQEAASSSGIRPNYDQDDYAIQNMLLEQQNEKREFEAKQAAKRAAQTHPTHISPGANTSCQNCARGNCGGSHLF